MALHPAHRFWCLTYARACGKSARSQDKNPILQEVNRTNRITSKRPCLLMHMTHGKVHTTAGGENTTHQPCQESESGKEQGLISKLCPLVHLIQPIEFQNLQK
jgi:hypothetical protein